VRDRRSRLTAVREKRKILANMKRKTVIRIIPEKRQGDVLSVNCNSYYQLIFGYLWLVKASENHAIIFVM